MRRRHARGNDARPGAERADAGVALHPLRTRGAAVKPPPPDKKWAEEASRAAAGAGLLWELSSAWCQQRGTTWSAEFTHRGTGRTRQISLSTDEFATPAARRDEIVRQLQMDAR
jgi:hypothetical protein